MYICDSVPDDVTIDQPCEWEWTTEPPTQKGWFWVNFHVGTVDFQVIEKYPLEEGAQNMDLATHWLGPLPVPEPPQE